MNNYFYEVADDVRNYVENEINIFEMISEGEFTDINEIREYLNDNLWTEDSVTGNGSSSYTFNSEEAKEKVLADMDTVKEALQEFCVDAETIGEKFLNEEWEYLDVTARCYVLDEAIDAVLEDMEDEINEAIEQAEAIEED